jgi:hypothetical protein
VSWLGLLVGLVCSASAAWVPLGALEPELDQEQILLPQASGARVLFTLAPPYAGLHVVHQGTLLPLQAGPQGSWVLPATSNSRELVLQSPGTITAWRETLTPVQVAWDRYEESLARWVLHGGELPTAPEPLYELEQEWLLRREAFLAAGEPVHRALMASMLLDLEGRRAMSGRDHPALILAVQGLADTPASFTVQGPGVMVFDVQVQMGDDPYLDFMLCGTLDDKPAVRRQTVAGPSEEDPTLGWNRRIEVVVPPGEHRVGVVLESPVDAAQTELRVQGQLTPTWRVRRSGWRRSGLMRRFADGGRPRGPLETLERDVVLQDPTVPDQARALLNDTGLPDAVLRLARLRLVEFAETDAEAVAIVRAHPRDGLLLAALARRWQRGSEIDPLLFAEAPRSLPLDPELLAQLAAAMDGPFIRPRGEAIMRLAQGDLRGWDSARWSALPAASEGGAVQRSLQGPGVPRVSLEPGLSARILLPEQEAGLVPVLRIQATEPVRYRVDGREAYGMGRLDEALSSGEHVVEVLEGRLWVLDAAAVIAGGTRYYEREQAPLPAEFLVPDPGAPVALALLPNHPGTLLIEANDGMVTEIEVPPGAERVVVALGPWATRVRISGPDHIGVSALMRHPKGVVIWPSLPDPGMDPVRTLGEASRSLVAAMQAGAEDAELAALRLQRAGAYQALGLNGSARAEANLVLQMSGATDAQRRQALAALPPVAPVSSPGPQTAEAVLALQQRLAPKSAQGWEEAASKTTPPANADIVWLRASEVWLAEGDPVRAYVAAENARDRGILAARKASMAGTWQGISAMDRHGGQVQHMVFRDPPDLEDGNPAQAREAALGSPWPSPEAAVLRPGREDRIDWTGPRLDLGLLCRDETFALAPQPCRLSLSVDGGPEQSIELVDGQLSTLPLVVEGRTHSIVLRLEDREGPAVVVRASTPEGPITPQVQIPAHRVGGGISLTVAGPALLRVKVHEGGPVQVRVGERIVPVEGGGLVVLPETGPLVVRVEGPPSSLVTLSRLEPAPPQELLDPALNSAFAKDNTPPPEALVPPAPNGVSAIATRIWMEEVAVPKHPIDAPMGPQGTFWVGGRLGDDLSIETDRLRQWRYLQLGAGYRQRGRDSGVFGHGEAYGRTSIDGPSAAGVQGQLHYLPERWVLSMEGQAWATVDAGHISGRLRARYLFELSPRWRVQPWAWLRMGFWTPSGPESSDPRAWTNYNRDHWAGAGLGVHVDYRMFRDLRLRGTSALFTNANGTLEKAGLRFRADWLLNPRWSLVGGASLERRFVDRHRDVAIWRPQVELGATWGKWTQPKRWWLIDARLRYLPLEQQLQGWVGLTVELAPRRGTYDHVPIDGPFLAQRDLPLEMR